MGSIHFSPGSLPETVAEIVGFKAGLALSGQEIEQHISKDEFREYWRSSLEGSLRIRSEEFEALVLNIFKNLGNISDDSPMSLTARLLISDSEPISKKIRGQVVDIILKWLPDATTKAAGSHSKTIDPTSVLVDIKKKFNREGVEFAIKYLHALNERMHRNPWSGIRRIDWSDVEELRSLFESESLTTKYGNFVDQRFIDYLQENQRQLGAIHWRKFEGLTAEFFAREGFHVVIGKGRADGGVDIRVWPDAKRAENSPPLILIQCKRQKDDVEQVIVKALWADVIAEGATSGLIVTTSRVAPGAKRVCTARSYPIKAIERETLGAWLDAMRTPLTGYVAW